MMTRRVRLLHQRISVVKPHARSALVSSSMLCVSAFACTTVAMCDNNIEVGLNAPTTWFKGNRSTEKFRTLHSQDGHYVCFELSVGQAMWVGMTLRPFFVEKIRYLQFRTSRAQPEMINALRSLFEMQGFVSVETALPVIHNHGFQVGQVKTDKIASLVYQLDIELIKI